MKNHNDPFAEIEIHTVQPATSGESIRFVHGQKITPSATGSGLDPVREKFYEMRGMAPINPNAWQDVKLFYKQGLFMEDFTDNFEQVAPLNMHAPTYQRLGYEQLRTYFTWRTNVWQGFFTEVSISYVFLHIYELISGIGVQDAEHGLYKLLTLWNAYRTRLPALDDFLPTWLKDYHVFYRLPHNFAHFSEYYNLLNFYPQLSMFDIAQPNILQTWTTYGSYDITKSKFYTGENKELMDKAFARAVVKMDKLCRANGKHLQEIFFFISNAVVWWPFEDAVFHHAQLGMAQPDREVHLSDCEIYTCRDNRWSTQKFTMYKHNRELIGYFIKSMELNLRTVTGFKGHFSASLNKMGVAANVLENLGLSFAVLTQLFEQVASDVYLEKTRIVVNVDRMNLIKIREEADEVQEKLIVEDKPAEQTASPQNIVAEQEHTTVETDVRTVSASPWQSFKSLLTPTEHEALKLALESPQAILTFAQQAGIMPEILADSINEKAMDTIGDNILEEMQIYDEYKQEVASL